MGLKVLQILRKRNKLYQNKLKGFRDIIIIVYLLWISDKPH